MFSGSRVLSLKPQIKCLDWEALVNRVILSSTSRAGRIKYNLNYVFYVKND